MAIPRLPLKFESIRSRCIAAVLLGALFTSAFAPYFIWPIIPIALSGLYLLLQKATTRKQLFWTAWLFGFGHHSTALWWTANALLTDAENYAWLVPFSVSLIPAALALYIGCAALLFKRLVKDDAASVYGVTLFAALWVAMELLRTYFIFPFPWNLVGYTLEASVATMQPASVFGTYGLSFFVMLAGTMPALLFLKSRKQALRPLIGFTLVLPLLLWGYGQLRLSEAGEQATDVKIRIVQPHIAQEKKWEDELKLAHLKKLVALSNQKDRPDVIVWPETATPYFLQEEKALQRDLSKELGENTALITGALRYRATGPGDRDFDLFNSLEIVQGGKIRSFYAKNILVPFGEYIPLRPLLPFVQKITAGGKDFSRGPGAVAIAVPGAPAAAPLICYEGIFPGYYPTEEYGWLVNVTNDGWFGLSSGPHQHFAMVRMRSVEQGKPLVRAANTGISAIVDSYGRITASLELGKTGIVDGFLPATLKNQTFYVKTSGWLAIFIIFATLAATRFTRENVRKT